MKSPFMLNTDFDSSRLSLKSFSKGSCLKLTAISERSFVQMYCIYVNSFRIEEEEKYSSNTFQFRLQTFFIIQKAIMIFTNHSPIIFNLCWLDFLFWIELLRKESLQRESDSSFLDPRNNYEITKQICFQNNIILSY